MNDDRYVIREDGIVTHERTVVVGRVPLKDFFNNVSQLAPSTISTPILPINTIRYVKTGSAGNHVVTVFHPSRIMTIFWHSFRERDSRPTPYNVAFPHMLFKMTFGNSQTITRVGVAIIKERPTRLQDRLYYLKMPNVHRNSDLVCMTPNSTPGDIVESCTKTLDAFFTGQSFNEDILHWPAGIENFSDWQTKTEDNPRFIESIEWDYMCTLGEWTDGSRRN